MPGGAVGRLVAVLVGVWVEVGVSVGVLVWVSVGVSLGCGVWVISKNAFCVESAWMVCTNAMAVCPLSGVAVAVTPRVSKLQALDSIAASPKNRIMTRKPFIFYLLDAKKALTLSLGRGFIMLDSKSPGPPVTLRPWFWLLSEPMP